MSGSESKESAVTGPSWFCVLERSWKARKEQEQKVSDRYQTLLKDELALKRCQFIEKDPDLGRLKSELLQLEKSMLDTLKQEAQAESSPQRSEKETETALLREKEMALSLLEQEKRRLEADYAAESQVHQAKQKQWIDQALVLFETHQIDLSAWTEALSPLGFSTEASSPKKPKRLAYDREIREAMQRIDRLTVLKAGSVLDIPTIQRLVNEVEQIYQRCYVCLIEVAKDLQHQSQQAASSGVFKKTGNIGIEGTEISAHRDVTIGGKQTTINNFILQAENQHQGFIQSVAQAEEELAGLRRSLEAAKKKAEEVSEELQKKQVDYQRLEKKLTAVTEKVQALEVLKAQLRQASGAEKAELEEQLTEKEQQLRVLQADNQRKLTEARKEARNILEQKLTESLVRETTEKNKVGAQQKKLEEQDRIIVQLRREKEEIEKQAALQRQKAEESLEEAKKRLIEVEKEKKAVEQAKQAAIQQAIEQEKKREEEEKDRLAPTNYVVDLETLREENRRAAYTAACAIEQRREAAEVLEFAQAAAYTLETERLLLLQDALVTACERGDVVEAKAVLVRGAKATIAGTKGIEPLGAAVWGMNPEVVNLLTSEMKEVSSLSWEECEAHNLKHYEEVFMFEKFIPETYSEWYELLLKMERSPFLAAKHLVEARKVFPTETQDEVSSFSNWISSRLVEQKERISSNGDDEIVAASNHEYSGLREEITRKLREKGLVIKPSVSK